MRSKFTEKVKEFKENNDTKTLVTNFRYVRGMQFQNVIIVLDPKEYFLKQYLPEAITRCTSNLALVMLEGKTLTKKEETVEEFVEYLEQKKPSVVEKWVTEKCEVCGRRGLFCCLHENIK